MRHLSLSQAWDETKAIITREGRLLSAVALALFVLPGIVLNLSIPRLPSGNVAPGPWMAIALGVFVITLVGQLSIIRLALGPHITVGEAIVHGGRRLFPYLGAFLLWAAPIFLTGSVLYGLAGAGRAQPSAAAAIGLLAVSFVGIFIAIRMLLLSAVASGESGGPIVILRRTWQLTKGNWWRLFAFLVFFGMGALVLVWAAGSVLGLTARLLFGDLSPLSVGGLLLIMVAQLLSAALSIVLFVMIARIYAQLAGGTGNHASVPTSGI